MTNILNFFGISARNIVKQPQAALSDVYIIDDVFVLRSRSLRGNYLKKLENECQLTKLVANKCGLKVPQYMSGENNLKIFIDNNIGWTLYNMINGKTLCTWYNLYLLSAKNIDEMLKALKMLHSQTKGAVLDDSISFRQNISEICCEILAKTDHFLLTGTINKIKESIRLVERYNMALLPTEKCILHGDYHPGNILFNNSKIVGMIDTENICYGSPLEDLGFTIMMFMRNFQKEFEFDVRRYEYLKKCYNNTIAENAILASFVLLFALFDLDTFENSASESGLRKYSKYQRSMVSKIADQLHS
jgi:aminoglycoside phosphotransferase